jgi:predicted nucleic acid-binding protein
VSPIFLDTDGLIALWDASDQWHSAAEGAYRDARKARREFCTTSFVMLECGNSASRRPYRGRVVQTLRQLTADGALHFPTDDDWRDGWLDYEAGRAGDASIVDCISFAVMRRLGITEVFTNDQHFTAAGFTTLF